MGNTIQLIHSPTGEDAIYYNGQFQYIDYGTTKADVEYDIDDDWWGMNGDFAGCLADMELL